MNPDFERLKRGLHDLGSDQMLHDLSNLAGQAIVEQVQVGFDTESDPYGVPWRPSRAAQREGRKTLTDSRKLRDGIIWLADVRDVVVKTTGLPRSIGYDRFNQYGTRRNVARPYLPQDDLPPRFEKAIVASFTAYLNSKYGERLMEEIHEALQAALSALPIFLGPEALVDQSELPHVVMIPISDTLSVPQKADVDTLAAATGTTEYICRAAAYSAARDTALLVLEALIPLGGQVTTASIRYGVETWGNYAVRVARLTVLTPMVASKEGVTRVRVEQFVQHVKQLPLTTLLPEEPQHGPEPEGTTHFEQSS